LVGWTPWDTDQKVRGPVAVGTLAVRSDGNHFRRIQHSLCEGYIYIINFLLFLKDVFCRRLTRGPEPGLIVGFQRDCWGWGVSWMEGEIPVVEVSVEWEVGEVVELVEGLVESLLEWAWVWDEVDWEEWARLRVLG
jgi:hypothetical protein